LIILKKIYDILINNRHKITSENRKKK